jgi:hypothetical protein
MGGGKCGLVPCLAETPKPTLFAFLLFQLKYNDVHT